MIYKAVISAIEGDRFRVVIDGRVSASFSRMRVLKEEHEEWYQEGLSVGDAVAVALFGNNLADGLILGKIAAGNNIS